MGEADGSEVRVWMRRSAFSARFFAMARSLLRASMSRKASERRAASCEFEVGGDEGSGRGESRRSGGSMCVGVPGGGNLSAFRIQDGRSS